MQYSSDVEAIRSLVIKCRTPEIMAPMNGWSAVSGSRALELAGINARTVNPACGVIVREPVTGEAAGTLPESAMDLVVLDRNLFDILPEEVNEAGVLLTLSEVREVYRGD